MYCRKCGKKISDNSCVCDSCGTQTDVRQPTVRAKQHPQKTNYAGIAALIFSVPPFVIMCGMGLFGFILSIFGMRFAKKNGGVGRQISFAAMMISGFFLLLLLVLSVAMAIGISSTMS